MIYLKDPQYRPGYPAGKTRLGAQMSEEEPFRIGERVRLSELGRQRLPRNRATTAVVVGYGRTDSRVRVRFTGSANPVSIHVSYLERDR